MGIANVIHQTMNRKGKTLYEVVIRRKFNYFGEAARHQSRASLSFIMPIIADLIIKRGTTRDADAARHYK